MLSIRISGTSEPILESEVAVLLLQLKIAYSVHRDLNVKANNDKSWDYTGGSSGGGTSGAAAGPSANGYGGSAAGGPSDEPPTGVERCCIAVT